MKMPGWLLLPRSVLFFTLFLSSNLFAAGLDHLQINNANLEIKNQNALFNFENLRITTRTLNSQFKRQEYALYFGPKVIKAQSELMNLEVAANTSNVIKASTYILLENTQFLFHKRKVVKLQSDRVSFDLGKGTQVIQSIKFECDGKLNNLGDTQINACLDYGQIKIEKLTVDKNSVASVLQAFPKALITESAQEKFSLTPKDFEDIAVAVEKGKFYLELKARFIFKLKLRVQGQAKYEKGQNSRLDFKIDKAHVSIFPIKKLILKAIKKSGIKNVSVEGDHVFLNL